MSCPALLLTGAFFLASGWTHLCLDESQLGRAQKVTDEANVAVYQGTDTRPFVNCTRELRRLRSQYVGSTLVSPYGPPFKCFPAGYNPDWNGDGFVGAIDYGGFAAAWLTNNPAFDVDKNGVVGASDYGAFTAAYGGQVVK